MDSISEDVDAYQKWQSLLETICIGIVICYLHQLGRMCVIVIEYQLLSGSYRFAA